MILEFASFASMGRFEHVCVLCGVSFAICRIRTVHEPAAAAWSHEGSSFPSQDNRGSIKRMCGSDSGCKLRIHYYNGDPEKEISDFEDSDEDEVDDAQTEHIAGPGCAITMGFSGHRISVREMEGCRSMQCLARKSADWKPDQDDQEFELRSDFFLTGIGKGSPDEAPLRHLHPVRHGVAEIWPAEILYGEEDSVLGTGFGIPFHPTCFEIFKKQSLARNRQVDLGAIWTWVKSNSWKNEFSVFARDPAVRTGVAQYYNHEPGNEYLAANPILVPGLNTLLKSFHSPPQSVLNRVWNVNGGVFSWQYVAPDHGHHFIMRHSTPPPPAVTGTSQTIAWDPFLSLPKELQYMILDFLSSTDIAHVRSVSRAFRQLPVILFRRLLFENMPWLWEAHDLVPAQTDWYHLYLKAKFSWGHLKGLMNRRRIWVNIDRIMAEIEASQDNKRHDI